jgi:hypothetical protein
MGGFPPNAGAPPGFTQGLPLQRSIQVYRPPQGGPFHPSAPEGQHAPPIAVIQAPPYSNTVKKYANWNACYSCSFDVPDGHTSMTCPYHLCKPGHDINFSHQNAQQYMDMGHPCCMRNCHKVTLPTMWWLGATNSVTCESKNHYVFRAIICCTLPMIMLCLYALHM